MNDIVTNYKGVFKLYYIKIINEIIKIGNLSSLRGNILDFGCGEKQLEKALNKRILNYDIDPKYSEIKDYKGLNYETIVVNQVFMYMTKNEISDFFYNQKKINNNLQIIVVISRHNLLTKILRKIFKKKKLSGIKSTFEDQLEIIKKETIIIKQKILFNNAYIFLLKF